METACWTHGYHLHSKDPIRQVFTGGRDEQDRCKPGVQKQGRGCGRRGRRRSRGHGTRGRTARRTLDKFRLTRKMHRWPTTLVTRRRKSEKITTQRAYPSVLGVQFASKRTAGKRRTEMEEEKRVVRPQFLSITKLLGVQKRSH